MRFNTLFKLSSLLSLASVAYSYSGRMTYYGDDEYDRPSVDAVPACGVEGVDLETDYFIALNENQYKDSLTKSNNIHSADVCNRCVKITYNNKWAVGKIIDMCPRGTCKYGALDLSPALFEKLENLDRGVIYADWEYTDCSNLGESASVAYSYSGRMTYYGNNGYDRPSVNVVPACGVKGVDLETDYYIALNENQYKDSLTKSNNTRSADVCNRCVKITYNNKWAVGKIIDMCPRFACKYGALDLSPALFEKLENLHKGVIYADWEYTDCSNLGESGSL
ncbi:hypothetical protein PIROE2DRAFT_5761 [Piromyces sp. E2]|nr:hypothetical protein PIROE2DRAFT_5761 [Piromyces sp. E2]|eukprot:OUM66902.1 hypothetical protein PIROE2DRAFT_5761 [Piromyces sp. E2]